MTDLVSIIVPAYNVADYLPRCLDSILAQSYPNIEIIAVDDGSSDHSGKVLDKYAELHSCIHVIHQKNGGVTSARLRGVAEASGEWIGFVDGDDEIESDMYERLLQNALKYNAEISHCGYQMHFTDGRINYFYNTGALEKQDRITALRELLSGERIEPGLCNKLFHKSLFKNLSMPMDIKINEDLLMNYYLFSNANQTVFNDWCPYHYIVRGTSASRVKLNDNRIYDPIRVKSIIRKTVPDVLQEDAQRAYINSCINTYHVLICAGVGYRSDRRKARDLLMQEQGSFLILGKKRSIIARFIVSAPALYRLIYLVYYRFFQNNVYS